MINIYDPNWLADFFQLNTQGRLVRRESVTTEFKREFDWTTKASRAKYSKTMAAFANNRGGCLIYGIKNAPHEVVGLSNFLSVDDAVITTFLNEHFTPYIEFDRTEYIIDGKPIGIICVRESQQKPIICLKDSESTYCSDIYFRYGAKSEKIKAGDLVAMLNQIREDTSRKWQNIFERCATIGIDNIGFLNTKTGEIKSQENTFVLDEALLNQIQVVDKYSEHKEGAPALRIIGEIPEVARIMTRAKPLYEEDLLRAFCTGKLEASPQDYLRAIAHGSTPFVPAYFLLHRMGLDIQQSIKFIDELPITHRNREKLLKRLRDSIDMNKKYAIHRLGGTPQADRRKEYFDQVMASQTLAINNLDDAMRVSESLFSFRGDIYPHSQLEPVYEVLRSYYLEMTQGQRYTFRMALTYVDTLYFRPQIDPAFVCLS